MDARLTQDLDLIIPTASTLGAEAVAQKIRIRINTHLGEWLLDTAAGIDYAAIFGIRNPNLSAFAAVIRSEVENTRGVVRVLSNQIRKDRQTRTITIDMIAEIETPDGNQNQEVIIRTGPPLPGSPPSITVLLGARA